MEANQTQPGTLSEIFTKAGIVPDTPVEKEVEVKDEKVNDKPDEKVDEKVESKEEKVEGGWESEEDFINFFKGELGYEGEVEGSGADAIIYASKKAIEKYKSIADDPDVKAFVEHREKGGNAESFQRMQGTNYYQDVEIDEDDVEQAENIAAAVLIDLQNYDPKEDKEEIESYIENLKDTNKLADFNKKWFPKIQRQERERNQEIKAAVEKEITEAKLQEDKYFVDLGNSFNKTTLSDISVSPEVLEAVKTISIPDKNNKIGIDSVLDNLTPEQVARMNLFAYHLSKGLPFAFNPKGQSKLNDKPILGILNKGKQPEEKQKQTFGQFIANKK